MATAAFFDLDKTILAKSSTLAFVRAFYDHGLIRRGDMLRGAYAQMRFYLDGVTHDQMEQIRAQMSDLVRGWDVDVVRRIVDERMDDIIEPMIHPEATALIDRHRGEGHDVHIISSSGSEVVEPIGRRLGVDITIGSRLEIVDGHYTGEIEFYAYGEGKADAMRSLSEQHGYDLAECYAYSDSQTDLPMLEAVGHPVAVNPDAELRRIALERGWPILLFPRPAAMGPRFAVEPRTVAMAAGAGVAIGAVALGVRHVRAR